MGACCERSLFSAESTATCIAVHGALHGASQSASPCLPTYTCPPISQSVGRSIVPSVRPFCLSARLLICTHSPSPTRPPVYLYYIRMATCEVRVVTCCRNPELSVIRLDWLACFLLRYLAEGWEGGGNPL